MASRLRPVRRFIDSRHMAKARPCHGTVKAGSSGSKWSLPHPSMPPMSWIPSTKPSLSAPVRPPTEEAVGGRDSGYLDRPGVDLEGARPPGRKGRVEHVERVERLDAV